MRILVTGAGGRIGTHLTRSLLADGHEVLAFGLAGDPRLVALGAAGAEICPGDLEQPDTLLPATRGLDAVCHLAAALTTHDVTDDRFVDVNLRGTAHLLDAIRRHSPQLRRFVYTSSDAVYWTDEACRPGPDDVIDEATPLRPGTVYGATKVGAELLCRAYWRTYGVPFTVMRPTATADAAELVSPTSVFGRRWFVRRAVDWLEARPEPSADELSLLDQLRAVDDGSEQLYALVAPDGTSSVSTLGDARDAAAGMRAMLADTAPVGEAFNIGPAEPHADRDLVEHIGRGLGLPVHEIRHPSARPPWRISSAKAARLLHHIPARTVFTMVDEAIAADETGPR